MQSDEVKIRQIIDCLIEDFAYSSQPNSRSGGLIGLAAVAIGLGVCSIPFNILSLVSRPI